MATVAANVTTAARARAITAARNRSQLRRVCWAIRCRTRSSTAPRKAAVGFARSSSSDSTRTRTCTWSSRAPIRTRRRTAARSTSASRNRRVSPERSTPRRQFPGSGVAADLGRLQRQDLRRERGPARSLPVDEQLSEDLHTVTDTEYWQALMALNTTDTDGTRDLVIPEQVRIYLFSNTQHGGGDPTRTADGTARIRRSIASFEPTQSVHSRPTSAAGRTARLGRERDRAAPEHVFVARATGASCRSKRFAIPYTGAVNFTLAGVANASSISIAASSSTSRTFPA